MKFDIVVAVDNKLGIGKDGTLPWRLPGDLDHFKRTTSATSSPDKINSVVMGRKTWDSIPTKNRPLKERLNIVVSRQENLDLPEGVLLVGSLDEALAACQAHSAVENCFVIGGAEIYRQAMKHSDLEKLHVTEIDASFDCDTFFPEYKSGFKQLAISDDQYEGSLHYRFKILTAAK